MQLGVQHLMGDLTHRQHLRQQLRDFHGGGTHQGRTTTLAHLHNLFDDGVVFLTSCLIHTVILVVTDHRTIGRNLHHIEFVDIPELTSLCRSRTGHTCQLVIHTEVVLQGDGGKGLSGSLYLHMLLGLYSLVQTVAPTTTFHDTARLLIHNLHLTVDHHILVILIKHTVGLQQLLQGVYALTLDGIMVQQLVFLVEAILVRETCLCLQG